MELVAGLNDIMDECSSSNTTDELIFSNSNLTDKIEENSDYHENHLV